jgi:hypothetical protein
MSRAAVLLLLAAGCAAPSHPITPPPDANPPLDLAGADDAAPPDLARVTDGPSGDLPQGDLAMSGCGVAKVVINEVQTGGSGGNTDEWVELYNPCPNVVNLAGSKLAYRSATNSTPNDTFTLSPLNLTIAAGGYLLIANSGYSGAATADIKPFAAGGLADTGGAVGLRDSAGTLVDAMGWGTASNPFVETATCLNGAHGQSMARTPNGTDTNNNMNDFAIATTPTPRAKN